MNAVRFIKSMREKGFNDDDISELLIFAEESVKNNLYTPTRDEIELATLTIHNLFAGASSEERRLLMEMVRKRSE